MKKEIIRTDKAWNSPSPISQATRFGNLVFTSGQGPMDPKSNKIAEGGFKQELRQALDNLTAVLEAAGLTTANIVKTTIFLSSMSHFAAVNEVYQTFFGTEPPARSTVAVAGLPRGVDVEIEAIAVY